MNFLKNLVTNLINLFKYQLAIPAKLERNKWYLVSCYVMLGDDGLKVESLAVSPKK